MKRGSESESSRRPGTDSPEARPRGDGGRVEEEEAIRGWAEETAMIIIGMCSLVASIQYTV